MRLAAASTATPSQPSRRRLITSTSERRGRPTVREEREGGVEATHSWSPTTDRAPNDERVVRPPPHDQRAESAKRLPGAPGGDRTAPTQTIERHGGPNQSPESRPAPDRRPTCAPSGPRSTSGGVNGAPGGVERPVDSHPLDSCPVSVDSRSCWCWSFCSDHWWCECVWWWAPSPKRPRIRRQRNGTHTAATTCTEQRPTHKHAPRLGGANELDEAGNRIGGRCLV